MSQKSGASQPRAFVERPAFLLLYAAVAAITLFSRFFTRAPLLAFYDDDFFYYLKIAQNIVLQGRSSFDGIHVTNGYHPLWELAVTVLYAIFRSRFFFVALQSVTFAAAIACYIGAERVFQHLETESRIRGLLTLVISLQCLVLFRGGMEIILTLPLGIWLLALLMSTDVSRWKQFALGFLASLVVLSRLDAIFLVGLLLLGWIWNSPQRAVKQLPRFLSGTALFPIYLAFNQLAFHSMLPVSGHAKQLKTNLLPSLRGPLSVAFPLNYTKLVFVWPCLLLFVVGVFYITANRRDVSRKQLAFCRALFLFPVVQLLALSLVSDWPLWGWYFYPLVFSSIAGFATLGLFRSRSAQTQLFESAAALFGFVVVVFLIGYSIIGPANAPSYAVSVQVAEFINEHPGVYAMGDRAGAVGYLTNQPIIQLEGLVMDPTYLTKIRRSEPLPQILKDYGVEYYIALLGPLPPARHCFEFREPSQAGPSSRVSLGETCASPIASFSDVGATFHIFHADTIGIATR